MRNLSFEGDSWEDYETLRVQDNKLHQKLCTMLREMRRSEDPSKGIGHPEPLKHRYAGCYSRHLSKKDRLIYRFDHEYIYIISLGGHYEDR